MDQRILVTVAVFIIGIVTCFIPLMIWAKEATMSLLIPFFTLGSGIFLVFTVKPEDRIFTQDIVQATDMFHFAMFLSGVGLGTTAFTIWFLISHWTWVPLGAIYLNVIGSMCLRGTFPNMRTWIQSH